MLRPYHLWRVHTGMQTDPLPPSNLPGLNLTPLLQNNPRFLSYCPYCQSSGRSHFTHRPQQRPRATGTDRGPAATPDLDPPPYSPIDNLNPRLTDSSSSSSLPPPYSPSLPQSPYSSIPAPPLPPLHPNQKQDPNPEHEPKSDPDPDPAYTTHHLRHTHPHDTILSLSLRYGIPAAVLRQHNNLTSDHLLAARQMLRIPTAYCTTTTTKPLTPSLSLSPAPLESEAERERKTTIRRWMVACKEADYDVAVVYLEEVGYDLEEGVRRYWEDERWEREHPVVDGVGCSSSSGRKGKKKRGTGGWGWGGGK